MNDGLGLNRSFKESVFPSFAKEGCTRPKENAAKHPLVGADGVVISSYRLFIPKGFDNRWLETTTPSAPLRNGAIFFMAQPPLLSEGGESATPTRPVRYNQSSHPIDVLKAGINQCRFQLIS